MTKREASPSRSARTDHLPFGRAGYLLWPIAMAATGAAVSVALLLLLLATEFLPSASMQRNLQRSIAQGSLQPEDWPWDRRRGFNQYNDCLLVMMTRFRQSPLASAIAPLVVFNDYPVPLLDSQGNKRTECAIAIDAVQSAAPLELFPPQSYFPYSRYVHGYRIPFHLLISAMPLAEIRFFYRGTVVTLLVLLLAGQLYRSYRAFVSRDGSQAVAALCFAGIAASFLLFSGVDLFAQSMTHGPSDIVLIAALGWLSFRRYDPGLESDVIVAVLAGLAFGFDFMHGTVPMMLAIVLGSMALQAFAVRRPILAIEVVRWVGAFVLGASGAVAAKLLAVLALIGWEGVASFFGQLSYRLGGDGYALADVVEALRRSAFIIGWGNAFVPKAAVIVALVAAAAAACVALFGRMAPWRKSAVLTAVLSIAAILAWYALFRNHTTIHGGFMVRLLAWVIGIGPACVLIAALPYANPRAHGDR